MKMKKLISGIICSIGILLAQNQASAALLSLEPSSSTVNVSESFTIDLIISEMSDLDTIGTFDIDISFDSSLFTFDSYVFGDGLGNLSLWEAYDFSDFYIGGDILNLFEVSLLSSGDPILVNQFTATSSSMTLATMTFSAIAEGTNDFYISSAVIGDESAGSINPELQPASVAVAAPVPEPSTLALFGIAALATFLGSLHKQRKNKR